MYRLISGLLASVILVGCNTESKDLYTKEVDSAILCPANMECGFMLAPKDYNNELGETVNIYYGVHKAQDPANRIGILVFNFGGPSAAAVGGVGAMIEQGRIPQDILNRFDIVGIDPRGTGKSAFAKELTECAVAQHQGLGNCNATYSQVAPYLGSNSVVKDIDRLRRHLGESRLNFLGYSYGTRLGSLYAKMFPDNVRAIVLDSPMLPTAGNYVDLLVGGAAGKDKIADYRLVYPYRKTQLTSIFEQLRTYYPSPYAALNGPRLTKNEVDFSLQSMVSRDSSYPRNLGWLSIKDGVYKLLDNDDASELGQVLSGDYNTGDYYNSNKPDRLRGQALFTAVICTDESQTLSSNDVASSYYLFQSASKLYGDLTFTGSAKMCADWPHPRDPITSVENMEQVLSGQNILVIAGQYDPATPYTWAEKMVQSFGDLASLITVDNYVDHGFSYDGIRCIDQNTTNYLIDPNRKIENQTCDVPISSSSFSRLFSIVVDAPHPAKNVIGW